MPTPNVLYPVGYIESKKCFKENFNITKRNDIVKQLEENRTTVLLSINRFSKHKNLELAIRTVSFLKKNKLFQRVKVVLAGGFQKDMIDYYNLLLQICREEKLEYSQYPNFKGDV